MTCDAIVIGAGPAGCAAAYDLAAAGRHVLLLDRRRFPRVKACAGGLTVKTLRRLRYSVAPVVRQLCADLVVGRRLEHSTRFAGPHVICALTVRAEFDDFCLRQTIARGADFRVCPHIGTITESAHDVTVETAIGTFRAPALIGADGANSVVRRFLPHMPPPEHGFAIEGEAVPALMPPLTFDFGVAHDGYGWLFPKRDHVNVGLFTCAPGVRPGRAQLDAYCRARIGDVALARVVGHAIGLGGWRGTPATHRILLAGDAAGLVEPLLGEGIHNAIASGQAAAAAVLEAGRAHVHAGAAYLRRLQPIRADVQACQQAAARFHRDLGLGYRMLTAPPIAAALMRGFARGMTLSAITRWFAALPLMPVTPLRI